MPTPMLLGIAGEKESGKNTAAEILEGLCGSDYRFSSRGLADVLKISAARALGFVKETEEQCIAIMDEIKIDGRISVEGGGEDEDGSPTVWKEISGREYLQFYGTEAHRNVFGDSFWVDYLIPADGVELHKRWSQVGPDDYSYFTQLMMVTDCRFPNEAQRVKSLGGFVIEIKKPGGHSGDQHASEKPLPRDLVDEIIHNDAGIEEFEEKLVRFFNRRLRAGLSSGSGRWN